MNAMIVVSCLTGVLLIGLAMSGWSAWTATRLARLHKRCESAEAVLRAQLACRARTVTRLARAGLTDHASAMALLDAAGRAHDAHRDGGGDLPWVRESELTRVLRVAALPGPDEEPLVRLVEESQRRASMARRIHNDGAAMAEALRRRPGVRWRRPGASTPPPAMIEFDDGNR